MSIEIEKYISLKKIQEKREGDISQFGTKISWKNPKDLISSANSIHGSIESKIYEDQIRYLEIKNRNELSNDKDNKDENNCEENELDDIKLAELKGEFEELLKQLHSLLAEIGGLLAELGSPPDKQKLMLLKEKIKHLELLRSRVRRYSYSLPKRYHKEFKVEAYFEAINDFVKENEGHLRQFAKDAQLNKNSKANKTLELNLQRDKIFQRLSEQLEKLQASIDAEKNPEKIDALQKELEQTNEQIKNLEVKIELENERSEALAVKKESEANGQSVAIELEMEEAAAAMLAELNGLIQGQNFGHANLLESRSMNMHKTMAGIINDFSNGGLEIENYSKQDIIKASTSEAQAGSSSMASNSSLEQTAQTPSASIENDSVSAGDDLTVNTPGF